MSHRPARSSSLKRLAPQSQDYANYPPLRDPSAAYESIPLSSVSSPDLSRLPPGAQYHSADRHQVGPAQTPPRGVLDDDNESPTSSGRTLTGYGDQPYFQPRQEGDRFGSLDLADAHSVSSHLASNTSRTPIHQGASVTMSPQNSSQTVRDKYKMEKSGYRSPRAHSHERSQGGGLGNWHGPAAARGLSPYGVLGQGNGSGQNSAANSNPNLLFSDGDAPGPESSNAFSRFMTAIFNSSFIVRWIIYILPFLGLLWIPGIVGLTVGPEARVWGVPLVWWSSWLSVVWVGWWVAALAARVAPGVLRNTVGVIAPELRHYILYVQAVRFYIGAAGWALADWVSFSPLIRQRSTDDDSKSTLSLCTQGLFGIFIVLLILLVEKLVIQIIAHNFHKKSYEDRILEQKYQIRVLVALYSSSRDIGRSDTLDGVIRPGIKKQTSDPALLVKKALHSAKKAAQSATTVIGTVASEIAGERLLQPNSPESVVLTALGSPNKTKQLARRIFFSYVPSYRKELLLEDISRCFKSREDADNAFIIFDRDMNGDISLQELEMSCLEIHRERLSLSNSMRDIDSAVQRLDSIVMSVWWVVSVLIIVGLLDASFNTLVASAGTLILGLSWLIGTTAQEVLASIIFLFIKHVYDVGDRVDIDGVSYVVKEMHLLSTIFRRVDGTIVQAPHNVLNTKFVNNIRRSGAILETFTWDVDFGTSFEKIEELRDRMLQFLENEKRDFLPQIDITVNNFEGQGKLTLSADIKYKSNWQNGALKVQRRNKWCCALKLAMASLEIFGPAGAGNPSPPFPDPTPYTLIPYEDVIKEDEAKARAADPKVSRSDVLNSGERVELQSPSSAMNDEPSEVFDDGLRGGVPGGLSHRK